MFPVLFSTLIYSSIHLCANAYVWLTDEMDDEIARKRARRKRIQQSSKKKRSKKEEKVQRRPLTERIMNAFGYTAQKASASDLG